MIVKDLMKTLSSLDPYLELEIAPIRRGLSVASSDLLLSRLSIPSYLCGSCAFWVELKIKEAKDAPNL